MAARKLNQENDYEGYYSAMFLNKWMQKHLKILPQFRVIVHLTLMNWPYGKKGKCAMLDGIKY